ncbi:uncharacterized protein LOC116846638 [Odontomachus brunneus]|uniref:uncharacterized protein LOC116846638 n=1 Tax=Odontomachus brunneus TaxID=486640 RepID=UPI0013F218E7|nr:uncharacterized protein LOC116846638 [Odontomachus brunneus]XP_032676623.1 uncharacterized protein LOC116846638 [Odontomachus brunneus]
MTKFMSNKAALEDIDNREPVMINSGIEEFMTLRDSVENSNKNVNHWINQTSKLVESNRNIEINYDKLMMKVSDINERMSETTRMCTIKKQELEDLQHARMISSRKQWNDCLSEIGNYANNFCQWITEYCSDVLTKDIENYHEECKKVSDDLAILKQELNDIKREHDLDYVEANMDIKDLSNLDTVISDIKYGNNNLMRTIRLTENSLSKIQNKIEQCKVAINNYETKKNTNTF